MHDASKAQFDLSLVFVQAAEVSVLKWSCAAF